MFRFIGKTPTDPTPRRAAPDVPACGFDTGSIDQRATGWYDSSRDLRAGLHVVERCGDGPLQEWHEAARRFVWPYKRNTSAHATNQHRNIPSRHCGPSSKGIDP